MPRQRQGLVVGKTRKRSHLCTPARTQARKEGSTFSRWIPKSSGRSRSGKEGSRSKGYQAQLAWRARAMMSRREHG